MLVGSNGILFHFGELAWPDLGSVNRIPSTEGNDHKGIPQR